ncbi:SusD/RagB family nutrient-binding outer membrane lipoprotein [Reichenbachiella ulvae]|uniref:SusD/RagB family nutrient-binding outer membrane lipoprotein n=1 Tax=Reichenbachiella ulvae TaxID=2980104 RepID=A0ABT3D118_9BACT|nr:SusD/RagB family nutrient-binding outer membrane lipoprotein [Reichenbachiella ulvae]MCV9389513.1 SusD/RagB family nutrient-binding outer membrane lipoprotein [Reichenbachiella ulvae]
MSDQNADVGEGFEGVWPGIDAGLAPSALTAPENFVQNNSRMNTTLRGEFNGDNARSWTIMPIAEVWFLRAEGALNGWNIGKTGSRSLRRRLVVLNTGIKLIEHLPCFKRSQPSGRYQLAWGDGKCTDCRKSNCSKIHWWIA